MSSQQTIWSSTMCPVLILASQPSDTCNNTISHQLRAQDTLESASNKKSVRRNFCLRARSMMRPIATINEESNCLQEKKLPRRRHHRIHACLEFYFHFWSNLWPLIEDRFTVNWLVDFIITLFFHQSDQFLTDFCTAVTEFTVHRCSVKIKPRNKLNYGVY